jgi:protein-disulfide isomerase
MGIDAKTLDGAQKGRVEKLLDGLANTRGCEGTLSSCIKEGDLTARRHGGYVARMVRKNKTDKDIESGIADRAASAFPARTFKVNVEDRPSRGKDSAPVSLVEFACFECPYCAYLAPKLADLGKTFGGKVRHVYKFFPVRSHERGVPAALSGLAAFRQDKFWPMHDLLYSNRAALGDKELQAYAKKVGLDIAQYKAAIAAPESMKVVEKDKLEGMRLGVDGTPAFFVNGKLYKGSADYDELMDRIAEEIDIVEGRVR